ncbi:MAG: hypothetical protein IJ110_01425 [Lachnospiraceae bacterium]|nr:hypothetical protein [Lachnospiraceae bacterium]
MINVGEDALICDFAETYGILDYRALPPVLAATLCCGLRGDSRVMMLLSGRKMPMMQHLAAMINDWLAHIAWMFSDDGRNGQNHPEQVTKILMGEVKEKEIKAYRSGSEFEAARERILRRIEHGGSGDSICADNSVGGRNRGEAD